MYNKLQLKLITGETATIAVEPPFRVAELVYHPHRRAVSLGNLTVLYEGIVYDVMPREERSREQRGALG